MRTGQTVYQNFFDNHLVEIVDEDGYRSLFFAGNVLQSRASLSMPYELVLFYTRYMMLALLVKPKPQHVLMLGIGAGSLVSFLHYHFPNCVIDAVDNSSGIIKLAVEFFKMPADPPIYIHSCDGLEFLKTVDPSRKYDVILIDAFDENGMSETIYNEEFFFLCRNTLKRRGVVSCNLWSGDSKKLEMVKKAFSDHLTSSIFIPVQLRGNIVGLGFTTPVPWERIDRPEHELSVISSIYNFDMADIVRVAKKSNMSSGQRLKSLFFRRGGSHHRN